MDPEQVVTAIELAWNAGTDQNLRLQAIGFVGQLRDDPSAWRVCLPLFTANPPPSEMTRHFCLEVVNNGVLTPQSDNATRLYIKGALMDYVQAKYGPGGEGDTPHILNKLAQTLTYLFIGLYINDWEAFFSDFLTLAGNGSLGEASHLAGTTLYLRLLGSIHDEIADQLISRSESESKRHTELKDLIRARDIRKISVSWQEILARWRQVPPNVVEMCLKVVSRWVSWIDISLVVNQTILDPLLQMAGQQGLTENDGLQTKVRDAAIGAFTEIASKKMRPREKVELIEFLNLGTVVGQLVASKPLAADRNTPRYDTDLAELVAKLVNNVIRDIVGVLDATADMATRERADTILQLFVPFLLRFFSDEYDEVCSTVIDSLTDLLQYLRKASKAQGSVPQHYSGILPPVLEAVIAKMKYDETASWGEEDEETDEAEFQDLRKRLAVLQQTIAAIDEMLYLNTVSAIIGTTFDQINGELRNVDWRILDLALHEMYLFGEVAFRGKGLYQKKAPTNAVAQRLIEMMAKMLQSNVAAHPHPAIQLQYMELCVRYVQFFEGHPAFIPAVLENFVRLMHSTHARVKTQSWYLFLRLARAVRMRIAEVSENLINAISDLLNVKAVLPEDEEHNGHDGDDSVCSSDGVDDTVFNSQLNIFEAIGCIASASTVPTQTKANYARIVIKPLISNMDNNYMAAKSDDDRAILQIHHNIMALGTLAKGFSDWMPGSKAGTPPPPEVAKEFEAASQATMTALGHLNSAGIIRQASRFCFARLIGVLGPIVLQQIPQWIEGLLTPAASKEELSYFLRLLEQVVFGFRMDFFTILDVVLTPLLQRVLERLEEPPAGTDDELQLVELRREFISFILQILNQDLGAVFISPNNQAVFQNVIAALELFACDASDLPAAKLTLAVLTKMTSTWGGPDVAAVATTSATAQQPAASIPAPVVPGFNTFAVNRFSPICWAIPSSAGFRVRDPAARAMVQEIAPLQQEIYKKTGEVYLGALASQLRSMGIGDADIELYVDRLKGDPKQFKDFLVTFLSRNGA